MRPGAGGGRIVVGIVRVGRRRWVPTDRRARVGEELGNQRDHRQQRRRFVQEPVAAAIAKAIDHVLDIEIDVLDVFWSEVIQGLAFSKHCRGKWRKKRKQ